MMKINAFCWNDLSRHRSPLMGLAMISVMLFHVGLPRQEYFYGLVRCGNVGVDMFLFLSGIGLWFSWTKHPDVKGFFRRRYLRVYPSWLLMAAAFYIPNYLEKGAASYSPDLFQLAANILVGWSFWRVDDLTFWFVPSIMLLYTFAPAYMQLIRRSPSWRWLPVLFMVWAAAVQHYPPVHGAVGHVEIFWSRIPVFLLGINCGEWVMQKRKVEPSALWLVLLLFALSLLMCVEFENHWRGRFPLFLERMVYIPLSVTLMMLLCRMLDHSPTWLTGALAFVGGISLELYLVHVQFVLKYLTPYHLGFWLTSLLMIAISLPLAWLLSKVCLFLTRKM